MPLPCFLPRCPAASSGAEDTAFGLWLCVTETRQIHTFPWRLLTHSCTTQPHLTDSLACRIAAPMATWQIGVCPAWVSEKGFLNLWVEGISIKKFPTVLSGRNQIHQLVMLPYSVLLLCNYVWPRNAGVKEAPASDTLAVSVTACTHLLPAVTLAFSMELSNPQRSWT